MPGFYFPPCPFGGLLPRPPPEGLPVLLGQFGLVPEPLFPFPVFDIVYSFSVKIKKSNKVSFNDN